MRVEKRMWLSQENKRPGHQKLPSPRTVWGLSTPSLIFTPHSRRCFYLGEVRQLWKLGLEQLLPGGGGGRLPWGLRLTSLTPAQEGQDRGPVFRLNNLTEIPTVGPPGKGVFAPSGLLPG